MTDNAAHTSATVPNGFGVLMDDGREFFSRKLVLATGITENLPAVEGIRAFYGTRAAQHCNNHISH